MSLLRADNLAVSIDGHRIIKQASLHIEAGELVGLIGPNGAGKSSLLKVLAGLNQAERGSVYFNERPLERLSAAERGRQLGYLAQSARAEWPVSVLDVVALGRLPYMGPWAKASEADQQAIDAALRATETWDKRARLATQLSGGEQTLVMLARVFAGQPQIIFADEPVAALDPYHQLHVMELLRAHAGLEQAGLVVLHDLNLAARFCDRLYLCADGEVAASGSPQEVLTAENLRRVYGVDVSLRDGEFGIEIALRQRSNTKS